MRHLSKEPTETLKLKVNIEEKNLIRRCKKGDSKAQFELYNRYYKAMYNTSLRILTDTAEAEDVMQEAFITAFDKIETFSGERSFGGWLKKIVVNRALDALRKRKIHLEEIDERSTSIIDDDEDQEKTLDKVAVIKRVLANMSEPHRVLITMHLFEGYPHEVIAEMLNMKHGAVRTGYARAKKKLQEELDELVAY